MDYSQIVGTDERFARSERNDAAVERYPSIRLRRPATGPSVSGVAGGKRPRVVLIEDHRMMRQSQHLAIEADGRLEVVGEADDGRTGLDLIRSTVPDVAAVDIKMATIDGWGVLEAVIAGGLATRIVFISAYDDPAVVQRALSLGATGFISKGTLGPDLCQLLVRAARGGRAVSADLQERLVAHLGTSEEAALSKRELEVLRCLASGRRAEEIGDALHLSTSTVRSHIAALLRKLDARNATEAVAQGFRGGLID